MSVVTAGVLAGTGLSAASAAGAFSGGGSTAPSAGSVGGEYLQLLNALGSGAPEQLSLQQQYQPQYTTEQLQNLLLELNGSNAAPGYLSQYANQVVPAITGAQTAANTALRAGNVADTAALGPGAGAAVGAVNPGQSALLSALTKTATGQLNLGTQLDPTTATNITQSVRDNWASRGLGAAAPAQLDEALQLAGGGQSLLAQREGEAGTVANLNQNLVTDPALSLIGVNSAAPSQAQPLTGTASGTSGAAGPTLYSTQDLESLMNTVFNAQSAGNIANANSNAALQGAGIGAGGNILGSLLGNPGTSSLGTGC